MNSAVFVHKCWLLGPGQRRLAAPFLPSRFFRPMLSICYHIWHIFSRGPCQATGACKVSFLGFREAVSSSFRVKPKGGAVTDLHEATSNSTMSLATTPTTVNTTITVTPVCNRELGDTPRSLPSPESSWNMVPRAPANTTATAPIMPSPPASPPAGRIVAPTASGMPRRPDCDPPYMIKPGDTCYAIASNSRITVDMLIQANPQLGGGACDFLRIGDTLCLPNITQAPSAPSPTSTALAGISSPLGTTGSARPPLSCALEYTVVSGDTCNGIWSKNGLSPDEFLRINPGLHIGVDGNCPIKVGDVVCIMQEPSPTAPWPPTTIGTVNTSASLHFGSSTPVVAGANGMVPSPTAAPAAKPPLTGLTVVPILTSSGFEHLKRWPPMSFITSMVRGETDHPHSRPVATSNY